MKYALLLSFLISTFCTYSQNGGETCADATIISSLPYVATGNILGANDDYYADCDDNGVKEVLVDQVFKYANGSEDIYVDISACQGNIDFYSIIYLYEDNCEGTPIACQLDGCDPGKYGSLFNTRISAQLLKANTTYFIVIDAYLAGSEGSEDFQLNINESAGLNALDSSNLPIVSIDTGGQDIVDEPKVSASMKIIYRGSGEMNHLADSANEYDGLIGIELRGNDSAGFPQQPFGIETRDSSGENNNVSILGMPEENDWILLSSFNDKVFFRNMLSSKLFNEMGHYAPRMQLCEVIINQQYNGVYIFTEKIKRDNRRVNISNLKSDENEGDDLTGGYIFRTDPWQGLDNSWASSYRNPHIPSQSVRFVYNYPDIIDITSEQKTYLQGSVSNFEDALWGTNFRDPKEGYRKYIDVISFIDYFIVNEFARNNDGFKKSRNFHKDKESTDPLIYAGPVWDFDWAYKDITETPSFLNGTGWQHSRGGNPDVTPPGWYIRMMQDTLFSQELEKRYFELRTSVLNEAKLFTYIDSLAEVVSEAQERHYTRWPTLGIAVGTSEFGDQPQTYAEEVIKFKEWISERLIWMDTNMPPKADELLLSWGLDTSSSVEIYPNPSSEYLTILVKSDKLMKHVNIYHTSGRLISSFSNVNNSRLTLNATDFSGIYLIKIFLTDGQVIQSKFISY